MYALTSRNNGPAAGTAFAEGPRLRDAAVLALLIGLFFSFFLGSRPLSVPDEGRYVEIPREMVETGDWLTPRLNGVKYFEKPPLVYWLEAALIRLFGLSEWSVRTGPALFALGGCLAVYFAGARLFGRRAGLLAAAVLSTSGLFYALSRLITLDMPVSALLTAALLSFLLGTREPAGQARRLFFSCFYAFAALATMTKGLIGIVFPGMIIFLWMLVTGQWRTLRSMHLAAGVALFLLIAAPWHVLVSRANPEFFDFYFIREHVQRYLTKAHHHYKPPWFYLPVLIGGLLPWSAFLVQALRHALPPGAWKERKDRTAEIFLLIWAVLIFLFFSASSSKLIPYLLPVLPPLALLIGRYLADAWDGAAVRGLTAGMAALALLAGLLLLAVPVMERFRPGALPAAFLPFAGAAAVVLLIGTAATAAAARKKGARGAVTGVTGTALLLFAVMNAGAGHLDTRSLKPLAAALKPLLTAGDEIAHYRNYYQDLPVYLERRMTVVDWKGELEFGAAMEDTSAWMITEAELWKRWQGPRTLYLVAGSTDAETLRRDPQRRFFLIARNRNTVILSNREARP